MFRITADRRLDAPHGGRDVPGDQREVGLADPARLELRHQRLLRPVVLGDHQQTAGVTVEPVDDPWSRDAGDPAVLRCSGTGKEGVDQRVAVVVTG